MRACAAGERLRARIGRRCASVSRIVASSDNDGERRRTWLEGNPPESISATARRRGWYLLCCPSLLDDGYGNGADGRCAPARVAWRPPARQQSYRASQLACLPLFWSYHLLRSCQKAVYGCHPCRGNEPGELWALPRFRATATSTSLAGNLNPDFWSRSGEVRPS